MAFKNSDNFDAPIVGMSLTHELGARPWQTPPELSTIEEALDFYIPRLTDKKFANNLLDILERGIPITSLSEVLTLGGVMEGLHSIDVAVLLNPILVELMEGIAKTTGIEYVLGDVDGKEDVPDALLVQNAMKDLDKAEPLFEEIAEEREEDSEEGNEDIIEDKPKGLMARKENN
jgi:hypothetical protein